MTQLARSKTWRQHPLAKHLIWIVLIKLAVLYGLWYAFVRPYFVEVTPTQIEQKIYAPQPAAAQGVKP